MNIFSLFESRVAQAVGRLVEMERIPAGLDLSLIVVETPRDPSHGDLSTNAALVIAKPARLNARELAEALIDDLRDDYRIIEASVAGPGFINLRISPTVLHDVLRSVLVNPAGFSRTELGAGRPINIEYVSANPTGPMHVGHGRGAVFGDALANLLDAAGWCVTREYYINDAGAQVDVLARSAFLRYCEVLGQSVDTIPEGLYPGDYLKPVGATLAKTHGRALLDLSETEWMPIVRTTAIDSMMFYS